MADIQQTILEYTTFVANQVKLKIPYVTDGNHGADAILHAKNPLWRDLEHAPLTCAARTALESSPEFTRLYEQYSIHRPQIPFEDYLDATLRDFPLKICRRVPAREAASCVSALVSDFLSFLENQRTDGVEFTPLFNLEMDSAQVNLDDDFNILPVDESIRIRVAQHFLEHSIVFSRDILNRLNFGIFRTFHIPIVSPNIAPPDNPPTACAELVFRILRPSNIVNCGFSAYWTTGWHLHEHAGTSISSQFPWLGTPYHLTAQEANCLPNLWHQVRDTIDSKNLEQKRYFVTARRRFVKAVEHQPLDDRLLDLFISLEALLLLPTERDGATTKVAQRLSVLLQPLDKQKRNQQFTNCKKAFEQRHTVAHGIDRQLVGFDDNPNTFNDLVHEIDVIAGQVLKAMIRLIACLGTRENVITILDKAWLNDRQAVILSQMLQNP